jgi:hypothetical protein
MIDVEVTLQAGASKAAEMRGMMDAAADVRLELPI